MTASFGQLVLALCLTINVEPSTVTEPSPSVKNLRDFELQVNATIKQARLARSMNQKKAAIFDLVDLHREIVGDTRFQESDTLRHLRGRVASVLIDFKSDLTRQARNGQLRKTARPPAAGDVHDAASDAVGDAMRDQIRLVSGSLGGPVSLLQPQSRLPYDDSSRIDRQRNEGSVGGATAQGAGGGVVSDDGPGLISLIQRTIRPEFWDVNGGPGTIIYWDTWHCLIVRATAEVHHQIGGLAGGLRQ
ncbi:MAG: hypothetical protein FJ295_06415 [Planctomycetes bacterium]|nr:hypothetical protein [Planctomycetota bacterium]